MNRNVFLYHARWFDWDLAARVVRDHVGRVIVHLHDLYPADWACEQEIVLDLVTVNRAHPDASTMERSPEGTLVFPVRGED